MTVMATEQPDRGYPIEGYEICRGGCTYWVVLYRAWVNMPEHEQIEAEEDGFRGGSFADSTICSKCLRANTDRKRADRNDRILDLHKSGLNQCQISRELDITLAAVVHVVRRYKRANR